MLTTHRRLSALIAVVAGLTLVAACGGGGSDDSSSDDEASANDDGSNAESGDGGAGGDLDVSDISAGDYSSGTVHVEMSGDYDGSADLQGGAASRDGATFVTFADDARENSVSISLNPDQAQSQVAVTIGDVTTGGLVGTECTVDLSGDGDSGFSGDFSCSDTPAIDRTSVEQATVDVEGSFTINK